MVAGIEHLTSTFLSDIRTTFSQNSIQAIVAFVVWLYFSGTFLFDVVHFLLHECSKSSSRLLRRVGYAHQVHHLYFNRNLKFNDKYSKLNLLVELPLELVCQLLGTWLGYRLAVYLNWVGPTLPSKGLFQFVATFEIVRTSVVIAMGGEDSNHQEFYSPPKASTSLVVGPDYHALHHVDPSAYISSTFRVFDWILGTSSTLRNRRVTITGASGAFGSAMKRQLQREGVQTIRELKFGLDWSYDDYERVILTLEDTDILILAHGSKTVNAMEANCTSIKALIDLFKKHHKPKANQKMLLPEAWYVGSEIELHPAWGIESLQIYSRSKRAFLPHARTLYDDPTILYRHIVPAAFQSPMGPAIVSGDWAAWVALWWIRRGARYVPVTYTGMAYVNYFKFMYLVRKA